MNRPIRLWAPLLLLGAALLLVACGQAANDTPTPSQSAGNLPTNTTLPPAPPDTAVVPAATAVPPTDTSAAPTDTAITLPTVTTAPPTGAPPPPTVVPTHTLQPATHTPMPPTHRAAAPTATPSSPAVIVGTSVAGGPVTSPPLRDITPQPPGGPAVTVTAAADGEATLALPPPNRPTVLLQVGQRLRLSLDSGYDWTITGDAGPILLPGNAGINPAAARLYTAQQVGTLTLQITADPTCLKAATPCERPSYFYSIPVTVR